MSSKCQSLPSIDKYLTTDDIRVPIAAVDKYPATDVYGIPYASVNENLAGVGSIETREDVHEGGLACAVLTEKAENLTLVNGDGDTVVRQNARELLRNLLQFKPHAMQSLPTSADALLGQLFRPDAEASGRRATTSSPKR